jgi:MFS family permease
VRSNPKFYGWFLLVVIFMLDFIDLGFPYYGASVINTYMLGEIHMSRSTLGLGSTFIHLAVGLAAPLAGLLTARFGVRQTVVLGSAIICASALFLAVLGHRPWHYLISFGIANGIGISLAAVVPTATLATRWFHRYRGRAMGIALSGAGISGFVVSWFFDRILHASGGNWRAGWWIVAASAVISGIIAALWIRETPESMGQTVDGIIEENPAERAEIATPQDRWTVSQAYRTSAFWLIAIAGIAHTYPYFFFVAHSILYISGTGISSEKAAVAMGIFTIATLIGRWVGGILMDFVSARVTYVLGLSLFIAGSYFYALINRPDAIIPAYVAAALCGCSYGWVFTCVTTMLGNFYGRKAFPKLYGTLTLFISTCASPAGYVGGKIFDVYGSYKLAILLNVILSAIAIVAILFTIMPTPPGGKDPALQSCEG